MQTPQPPNDSQNTLVDPTTPNGSRIYILATPPPGPQNGANMPAPAAALHAEEQDRSRSLTPFVVNDTFDSLSQQAPPLTQLRRAPSVLSAEYETTIREVSAERGLQSIYMPVAADASILAHPQVR